MSLLDYAQGKLMLNQALSEAHVGHDGADAAANVANASTFDGLSATAASSRLRELAIRNFTEALRSDTLNLHALKDKVPFEQVLAFMETHTFTH